MEPGGCNRRYRLPLEAAKQGTVASGCQRLPETFHGKRASAAGCHPLRKVPSL